MSLSVLYSVDGTFRAVATNGDGKRWNGSSWETHTDGNWATYLITPAAMGTSVDQNFTIPDGATYVAIYTGSSPVVTDAPAATVESQLPIPANVDQQPIASGRIARMKRVAGSGLVGESTMELSVGESQLIAADFFADMPTNSRISSATFTVLTTPDSGDMALGVAGVDYTLAKVAVTPDTAGTYTVECVVAYADGGGSAEGLITIEAS